MSTLIIDQRRTSLDVIAIAKNGSKLIINLNDFDPRAHETWEDYEERMFHESTGTGSENNDDGAVTGSENNGDGSVTVTVTDEIAKEEVLPGSTRKQRNNTAKQIKPDQAEEMVDQPETNE